MSIYPGDKASTRAAQGAPTSAHGAKLSKKATSKPTNEKLSGLDAAAAILAKAGKPLTCREITDQMVSSGLWSTKGKTPHATVYSAILRDIDGKPGESRFEKTGRGLFALKESI